MSLKITSARNSHKGFTLIELVIVVALIAIVAAYAVPSFGRLIESNRVSSTANGLLGALNYARSEAVKVGRTVNIRPVDGAAWGSGLLVWLDADGDNTFDANEELRRFADISTGLTVTGSATTIGFRGNGFITPESAAEFQLSVASTNTATSYVCTGLAGRIRTASAVC